MSKIRLYGASSGYTEIIANANASQQSLTLPNTAGTLDRLERAGNILQVVNATYSTSVSNSTSTYTDTGLTATITPTSATSKILVLVNQAGCGKDTGNTYMQIMLLRGSTTICNFDRDAGYTNSTASSRTGTCSACYLDSPSTTSATTYKTQFRSAGNIATVIVQSGDTTQATSTITLLEVAA